MATGYRSRPKLSSKPKKPRDERQGPRDQRRRLVGALSDAMREMSGRSVMFHQRVADELGLKVTDHKCLELVHRLGPLTAGQLAELTGLTSGAITGVIDRLERAGFARREPDADDRRRVFVHVERERAEREIAPIFRHLGAALRKLAERYTDAELALVLDFMSRSNALPELSGPGTKRGL